MNASRASTRANDRVMRRGDVRDRLARAVRARAGATGSSETTVEGSSARAEAGLVVARAPACALEPSERGTYAVRGVVTVRGVDGESVYNLLTDYGASPRTFRAVRSVREIACEGDACVPSNVYIEQECEWKFFVFGGAFPTAFEVEERDDVMQMRCSLAPGKQGTGFLRAFEGAWFVTEDEDGVRIEHTLKVAPKFTPPYASKIFAQQVEQILEDLLIEIESWNGKPYGKPPHRRDNI